MGKGVRLVVVVFAALIWKGVRLVRLCMYELTVVCAGFEDVKIETESRVIPSFKLSGTPMT